MHVKKGTTSQKVCLCSIFRQHTKNLIIYIAPFPQPQYHYSNITYLTISPPFIFDGFSIMYTTGLSLWQLHIFTG